MTDTSIPYRLNLRAGDWVLVRSKEEILGTLDPNGRLEQMPFMPEMFQFCGKKFQVSKRAHKTCDPSLGLGGRRLNNTVHLQDLRCDGQAHDGCDAGCLIFWKEAWVKRVSGEPGIVGSLIEHAPPAHGNTGQNGCSEEEVWASSKMPFSNTSEDTIYVCQNTQLKHATTPLPWWDLRQFVEDYTSGNVSSSQMIAAFLFFLWHTVTHAGLGIGSLMQWAYDGFQKIRGGSPYPWRRGRIPKGSPTPCQKLNLEAGELVRVKPYPEILATLDEKSHNRGMYFDGEMVPYTEGSFRVMKRVRQIIDEKTGKMVKFKTDAIILENAICQSRYAKCRHFCPRGIHAYWREIWLERVHPNSLSSSGRKSGENTN